MEGFLENRFVTGVSPVVLADMSSGYNKAFFLNG